MNGREGYKQLCGWAFENIAEDLRDTIPVNARIVIDGSGDKRFNNELRNYLRSQTTARNIVGVKDVRMSRSESDPLVQLADYVASATNRYFLEKPSATIYSSLLAEKLKSRRIWP